VPPTGSGRTPHERDTVRPNDGAKGFEDGNRYRDACDIVRRVGICFTVKEGIKVLAPTIIEARRGRRGSSRVRVIDSHHYCSVGSV